MSTEDLDSLVKKEAGELAKQGFAGNLPGSDLLNDPSGQNKGIPFLTLAHPMGKVVQEGKCEAGDYIESSNDKILCKAGESIEIIPLYLEKIYIETVKKHPVTGKEQVIVGSGKWDEGRHKKSLNVEIFFTYRDKDGSTQSFNEKGDFKQAYDFYFALKKDYEDEKPIPYRFLIKGVALETAWDLAKYYTKTYKLARKMGDHPFCMYATLSTKPKVWDGRKYTIISVVPGEKDSSLIKFVLESSLFIEKIRESEFKRYASEIEAGPKREDKEEDIPF